MTQKNIVIYSTNSEAATLVKEVVRTLGCTVTCCHTEEQTIDAVESTRPAIVILLSISPLINGSQLIPRLRPNRTSSPAIFVIAWQQAEQTILSILEGGIDQYMTFPISIHRLYNKTQAILKQL